MGRVRRCRTGTGVAPSITACPGQAGETARTTGGFATTLTGGVMLPRPLLTGLTVLISIVWAGNVVAGYLDPAHHDATINAIFGIVVGSIYGLSELRDRKRRKAAVGRARRRLAELVGGDSESEDDDQRGDDR